MSMCSYAPRGCVFVLPGDWPKDVVDWRAVERNKALERPATIIRCYYCERPATRLDGLWPYHHELNACTKHRNDE